MTNEQELVIPSLSATSATEIPSATSTEARALESLGIVVGELAHDFNNVLAMIFGYAEMALGEIPEGHRARSDLEQVLVAGERAKELVAKMQTYGNRARLKKQELDLRTPLQKALHMVRERLPPATRLQVRITQEPAFVVGNEVELAQVVLNLCNNSVQALGGTEGQISVGLEVIDRNSGFQARHPVLKSDVYAVLTVSDDGSGMDAATLAKIYTPFFTTRRGSGRGETRAGLGLTMVQHIVASMNGAIFVHSLPGKGTTFELYFPLTQAKPR